MANHTDLDPMSQEAIKAALANDWERALKLNEGLLKKYPDDINIMNRLARSLGETGKVSQARKLYQDVLKLDPYNSIAEKNLHRLSTLRRFGRDENKNNANQLRADVFLEEPGKTIVVPLADTAMSKILADLQTGDNVNLVPHRNDVTVVSSDKQRIGKVEAEIAKIISSNIRAGSKFDAFIKSIAINSVHKEESKVTIFVREVTRSSAVTNPPFPIKSSAFTPYVREEAMTLISDQHPVQTEADSEIEEVEVADLPSTNTEDKDQSLEELAEKEAEEDDHLEEE
jgi:hypothetical protein